MLWNAGSKYTVAALRPAILSEAEEAPKRRQVPADSVATPRDTTVPRPLPTAAPRDTSVARPTPVPPR
jgi:hypothetical protein